ncbi:4-Cys prefix domain-containing protein [Merismopedia glauca]|uniref:4-Cys prefix domain-containing protein n=1 Tax=Merismopedia glauca TaxID=292586 RepID=UPI003F6DDBE6
MLTYKFPLPLVEEDRELKLNMEILCTRPKCLRSQNSFPELDDRSILKSVPQKYCTSCGMPLILGDRYIPSKLLGRGGFGAAFLARDRYTPKLRECVVKQFLYSLEQPFFEYGNVGWWFGNGVSWFDFSAISSLARR